MPGPHCHWCGRSCLPLLRQGFLRRRRRHRGCLETTRGGGQRATVTPPEIEAQVLRYYHAENYYHAEKWTTGTIARQLHVHHSVVRRVLAQAGLPRIGVTPRPSQIDPYLSPIRDTLEKFPTLTASRLFAMAYERGYRGSPDHFRHLIALHRPRRPAEAHLRLRSLPGFFCLNRVRDWQKPCRCQ